MTELRATRWYWEWKKPVTHASKIHLTAGGGVLCGATYDMRRWRGIFVRELGGSPLTADCPKCLRAKGVKEKLKLYMAYIEAKVGDDYPD